MMTIPHQTIVFGLKHSLVGHQLYMIGYYYTRPMFIAVSGMAIVLYERKYRCPFRMIVHGVVLFLMAWCVDIITHQNYGIDWDIFQLIGGVLCPCGIIQLYRKERFKIVGGLCIDSFLVFPTRYATRSRSYTHLAFRHLLSWRVSDRQMGDRPVQSHVVSPYGTYGKHCLPGLFLYVLRAHVRIEHKRLWYCRNPCGYIRSFVSDIVLRKAEFCKQTTAIDDIKVRNLSGNTVFHTTIFCGVRSCHQLEAGADGQRQHRLHTAHDSASYRYVYFNLFV